MNDLSLMKGFRAERNVDVPEAREAIWQALEARIGASEEVAIPRAQSPRRGLLSRRRRLLAFAGTTACAAAVAGTLVLGSGPTAQSASAEILHGTAAIAAASDARPTVPGPGQFYYKKFERLELEGWIPGGSADPNVPTASIGAPMTGPGTAGAVTALVPTTQEWWIGADGAGRIREVAGTPEFLTPAEKSRWEEAGSQLPPPFDPGYQREHPPLGVHVLEMGAGVMDTEHGAWKGYEAPDTSGLPTDPAALRQSVEDNSDSAQGFNRTHPSAEHLDADRTAAELLNILAEGNPSPQLQAAIFNALAELPDIKVDTKVTDGLGRRGDAIHLSNAKTGTRNEYIFDPATSKLLAQRSVLVDPKSGSLYRGLPAGTTISETDYLMSGVVDSTHATGQKAEATTPGGTAGPVYRR